MKILFVVNPVSGGKSKQNWELAIRNYFEGKPHAIEFFLLSGKNDAISLEHWINKVQPNRVVAVGGDGTVNLVAKKLLGTPMEMGILPAGSANGLARELDLPLDPEAALEIIESGRIKKTDALHINDEYLSIHLADLGLNAQLIKYFDESNWRGKLGYAKVFLKTIWNTQRMKVFIETDTHKIWRRAFMVVLANCKSYGTGAVINPTGDPSDGKFEIVVVRKLAFSELFKMALFHKPYNPKIIEVFSTTSVSIRARRKVHFQSDGEYFGRIQLVKARIIPGQLNILVRESR